jgi:ATP-dependent DNA helicase RecQ
VLGYYQQVGRAGRQIPEAHGVLLSGAEETDINDFFIESAFPSREEVEAVLAALRGAVAGFSINEFLSRVNIRRGRIDKALQLMSLESPAPVVKQGSKWILTAANLSEGFWQRAERVDRIAPGRTTTDAGLCGADIGPHGVSHSRARWRSRVLSRAEYCSLARHI